jgi:hypothetical protein
LNETDVELSPLPAKTIHQPLGTKNQGLTKLSTKKEQLTNLLYIF